MQPPIQRTPGTSGRAVAVLVLGILGLTGLGCLAGLPAWILGNQAMADIRRGALDARDEGFVQVGRVLGIVTTAITGCGLAIFLPFYVITMGAMTQLMSSSGAMEFPRELAQAGTKRNDLMSAAIAERRAHPTKDYRKLAKELTAANGKRVPWYPGNLSPGKGCGEYKFSGENGMFTIKDGCGSSTSYGWPPEKSSFSNEDSD